MGAKIIRSRKRSAKELLCFAHGVWLRTHSFPLTYRIVPIYLTLRENAREDTKNRTERFDRADVARCVGPSCGMSEDSRPPASTADGANAAPGSLHSGGIGGGLRDSFAHGFRASSTDATMRIFDQREGWPEGLLPNRRTTPRQHHGLCRITVWVRSMSLFLPDKMSDRRDMFEFNPKRGEP